MAENNIFGKMLIEGNMTCLTGLHIGGNKDVSEIGGVDLLVIRDAYSREPYIPGSSLKGKLRSLLEKYHYAEQGKIDFFNKCMPIGGGQMIRYHECGDSNCTICNLFGASRFKETSQNIPAHLYIRDAYLTDQSREQMLRMESAYYLSEVKFENTLDRITCAANPRQIERVPRGAEFSFQMVYNTWQREDIEQVLRDMKELFISIRLLNNDYLGGHGSRGYGNVEIKTVSLTWRDSRFYAGEAKTENKVEIEVKQNIEQVIRKMLQPQQPEL